MNEGEKPFRFHAFADAASAQAAFEAAYPPGSAVEPALQALVDMGAHCKAVGPTRFACRYVEAEKSPAGWCWQVALESDAQRTIRRSSVTVSILGM
jgi:hypothetical protein